jgi:phospholipase/carboxylesterase
MRPVTINGGFVMRAWYDIAYQELAFKEDERGMRESQKLIEGLIARENARGIPSGRIVLAGFSQGGVITLQAGLRQRKRLAGLMALSAHLPMSPMVEVERNAASNTVPIFMGHGIADNIVPLALGTTSRDTLIKLGYDVEWHQYPMPHSVCAEELADISAWLKRVLL